MLKDMSTDDDNLIKRSEPIVASKSVGSFVKIDSISIDLADADDDNSHGGKCEHFSIRGYVSEIRKKNWKICWPFALDGDSDKSDQEKKAVLPPLDAPKFRSWCCQNCLREIGSKNVRKGHGTEINCHVGSNSKCTGTRILSTTATALLQSDYQEGPKSKTIEEKQTHAYTYTIVDGSERCPSSRIDKKKRNGEVSLPMIIANENGLANSMSHEMPRFDSAQTEVNTSRMQERRNHVAEKLDCNGSGKVYKPGCENNEDAGFELEIRKSNFWIRNSTQNSETEYHSFAGDKQKDSINASGLCKAGMICETANPIKVQTNVCRPLILDECDYASSENHEKASGFHRKKSRKVRLLTELLCTKEEAKTDHTKAEDSPSNMVNNTSAVGLVSQGQVSLLENVRVGSGENKKRKFSEEEEKGGQETSNPKLLSKKVKSFRRDREAANAIVGPAIDENAPARISLQADMKNSWSRYGNERNTVGKKKAKKIHDFDAWSSLAPTAENVPIEAQEKYGSSHKNATNGASFRLMYDPSQVKGTDMHSSKRDRKSGFVKRKGKMPQSDTGLASLPNTRKNAETKPNGQGTVPIHPVEDASTEKGLDLSLNSYLATQRYDGKCLPQQDGFPSLSTWKDSTCKLDEFMRKNVEVNFLANLNKPSTSMENPLSEDGVRGERSKIGYTYSMPILNEKQNYSSQVEQGSCSLMQQMDVSCGSKNQNIIDVEKNSGVPVIRKHTNHHQTEMSEKNTIDDIPMEIVELMAKNQYERCLQETQNDKHVLETPSTARNTQMMERTQIYGIGDPRVLEETSQKRKSQSRNAKNGTTRKNVAPAPQKSVDYFPYTNGNHFGLNRVNQMHYTTGFGPFSQSQKKPSSRAQFPGAGNSKCSCAQSCKWDGNMMIGHGFSNSNLHSFAACNTCHSVPQSKEEATNPWSPVISTQMPFGYKNPQKGAAQSSHVKMLSSHSSGPLQKGNANGDCDLSLNLNALSFEKRNEAVGSETISRTNPEYSFTCKRNRTEPHQSSLGSLDLYSNETIPAMHLLSLMDASMRSGASLNMGGNPKCPKRPLSNDLNSKGYPGLNIGLDKATDTVNHLSSNCYGKNHLSEKSLDLFPTNPTFGASTSFGHSNGFGRATDFMGQVLSSQKKENILSPAQNRGPISEKPLATYGGSGNNHTTIPVHGLPKGFLPVSGPMMFPLHYHTIANSRKHNPEASNANGTMKPPKTSVESPICCINRNPADFSMPDVGNGYMIRGEDLKVGKKISSVKRRGLFKVDQQKRQRNTKHSIQPIEKDSARR
ncbi:protein EMBRYONIC FLOWER 1 [Argentina anserina]|uniref:protein EMBRYONIC FLOWER 1 n=1 Tax=Argentina anserina TaxID=57926 RepID=UPI0021767839|nr:protein EMBRYONIC FLOWER 1 [Potentilla anserina]